MATQHRKRPPRARWTVGREDAIRDLGRGRDLGLWMSRPVLTRSAAVRSLLGGCLHQGSVPQPLSVRGCLHRRRRSSEQNDTDRQEPSKATYAPTPCPGKAGATTALLRHTTMNLWLGGAKVARGRGVVPTCREPSRLLPTRQVVALGWPHPSPEGVPSREGLSQGRAHRPCHQRAIHTGHERTTTENTTAPVTCADHRSPC